MFIGRITDTLPILLGIAVILYGVKSSRGSSLENDVAQQKLLMDRVGGLESKMNQLTTRLEKEIQLRENLQALNSELAIQIDQLVTENMEQNQRFKKLESEFEAKIDLLRGQQDEEIQLLKNKPSIKRNSIPVESDSSPRLPPPSCRQLSTIGHYLDGIYLVANPDTKKIEAIYCEFGSSTLSETFYGSVDVKSKSVHFTVQRTSSNFDLENAVIPFDIERLNVGGAMNMATGVFVAPVNGIYHFEFNGMKYVDSTAIFVFLQVNGDNIGSAYATNLPNYLGLSGISASLKLKSGDQVRLFKTTGTLHEWLQYTFFTGWLVEEDLVLG